ncbi:MAG: hypothetical protein ACK4S4_01505 [Pyrinomonadaceae bacterium]
MTSFVDSPLPRDYTPDRGSTYAAKSVMAFALTATTKNSASDGEDDCEPNNPRKPCIVTVKAEPQPIEIPDFKDASVGPPLGGGLRIVGFGNRSKEIEDQISFMTGNEGCAEAFKAAGLRTVGEMIGSRGGLNIVHYKTLDDSSNNSLWRADENMRQGMRDGYVEHMYANGYTAVGPYNDGYYSSLSDRAFTGWDDPLTTVIIHEMIHAAGSARLTAAVPNYVNFPADRVGSVMTPAGRGRVGSRKPNHDLEWMNFSYGKEVGLYDSIIRACTPKS